MRKNIIQIAILAILLALFTTCKDGKGDDKVTNVTLDKDMLALVVGDTETLNVSVMPENAANKAVTFESNNTDVATVMSSGLVIGISSGTATVTVKTIEGGYTATCFVIVTIIKTYFATNITYNAAKIGGTISKDDDLHTEGGIVYATKRNPETKDVKMSVQGAINGDFIVELKDLEPITTYYARSYAINLAGTVYGNEVSFITKSEGEPEMTLVNGGTFTREGYQVTLSGFYIGKYQITQAQWRAVMSNNPSYFEGDNHPVESVSWHAIVGTTGASMVINGITYYEKGFIYKLNEQTGKRYRLPTEAEWEYAARGGNQSQGFIYSGSNNIDDVAWYYGNNTSYGTKPVGTKQPNELGIYDMSGNVWEWCSDWYGSYPNSAQTNPTGPETGSNRVLRGGGWGSDVSYCRVSVRAAYFPGIYKDYGLGFRLALSL